MFLEERTHGWTTTTGVAGTERYMAPELVFEDDDVVPTACSDIWALGCVGLDVCWRYISHRFPHQFVLRVPAAFIANCMATDTLGCVSQNTLFKVQKQQWGKDIQCDQESKGTTCWKTRRRRRIYGLHMVSNRVMLGLWAKWSANRWQYSRYHYVKWHGPLGPVLHRCIYLYAVSELQYRATY